jgi:hypothetical protein
VVHHHNFDDSFALAGHESCSSRRRSRLPFSGCNAAENDAPAAGAATTAQSAAATISGVLNIMVLSTVDHCVTVEIS